MAARRSSAKDDPGFLRIRAKEIQRVMLHRYGKVLPDDDAGRGDLHILLRHLAHLQHGERRMANYMDVYVPWMAADERSQFMEEATRARPPRLKADTLALRLGLTDAVRAALNINTIGAVDVLLAQRRRRRLDRGRERQERRRRKIGRRPRAEYLAAATSKLKPWEAEGISKRTWYRRQSGK